MGPRSASELCVCGAMNSRSLVQIQTKLFGDPCNLNSHGAPLYWIRPLTHQGQYYLLKLAVALLVHKKIYFTSPASWSFQLEMLTVETGTFCMSTLRCCNTEPHPLSIQTPTLIFWGKRTDDICLSTIPPHLKLNKLFNLENWDRNKNFLKSNLERNFLYLTTANIFGNTKKEYFPVLRSME